MRLRAATTVAVHAALLVAFAAAQEPEAAPSAAEAARATRRGTVEGRVLSRESDEPLVGARVEYRPEGGAPKIAVADAAGAFRLDELPRSAVRLLARASGREPEIAWVYLNPARAVAELNVRLGRARPLVGRVLDADGRPVVGALVAPRGAWHLPVSTDVHGRFRAPYVDPTSTLYDVFHPDFAPGAFRAEDATTTLVRDRSVLEGRVTDVAGEPIVDADVEIESIDASDSVPVDRRRVKTRSGLDGTFEASGVPPGPIVVRVAAEDFLPWTSGDGFRASLFDLFAPVDPTAPPARVAVLMSRPRTARGVALYDDGVPLAKASLRARAFGEAWSSASTTDEAGRFVLDVGEGRRLAIEATSPEGDLLRTIDPAVDAEGRLSARFRRPRSVSGVVVDATTRRGLPDVEIIPRRGDDLGPAVGTDDQGRFRARLREDDDELQAAAFGYGVVTVRLDPDVRDGVVVALEPTAIVEAAIEKLPAAKTRGAVFTLTPADARAGEAGRSLIPDATGYGDFTGVFEGRWRLALVGDDGEEIQAREIDVPSRGVVAVRFGRGGDAPLSPASSRPVRRRRRRPRGRARGA
jgi:hypothetical protein